MAGLCGKAKTQHKGDVAMRYGRTMLSICILTLAAFATTASSRAEESREDKSRARVTVLELTGDLRTHDPALIHDEYSGDWFVFSTGDPLVAGGTIQIRRSADLHNWTYVGTVFNAIPAWITQAVPGVTNLWAPEVHEHDGMFYLYYAASTFGSNRSVIGLATNRTLDPNQWVDQGLVAQSQRTDDFNAIDPAVIEDRDGTPYLSFGSFWSGIRMWTLQWPSGKLAPGQGAPTLITQKPAGSVSIQFSKPPLCTKSRNCAMRHSRNVAARW